MEKELALQSSFMGQKPVGISASTGLTLYQSVQCRPGGFIYGIGVREAHGLHIVEAIADGTGCTLLCGIQVRDKETGKEICSIPVEQNTRYSRQTVVKLVQQYLCDTIADAAIKEGKAIDRADVEWQVAQILDDCYFSECRKAGLQWAERMGIIKAS